MRASKWSLTVSFSKTLATLLLLSMAMAVGLSAQSFQTLHGFSNRGSDGGDPLTNLVRGVDGDFYGTTAGGGLYAHGTVFKITPGGTLTTLYSFCGPHNCPDGDGPAAGLVLGSDGNFYGTTANGGANGFGTVFQIAPNGTLTSLYSFLGSDGANPNGVLIQATDGNFYGTTLQGGGHSYGTLFKITSSGTLTTVYNFCALTNCADGRTIYSGVIQAPDGNFYGTTFEGGANGFGTVYKITPAGTLTTLYSFCPLTNCPDGGDPWAGLVRGSDGNFYGTTLVGGDGGVNGGGVIYKITPSGTLTTLYSAFGSQSGLIQATDGKFYGASRSSNNIFKITADGALTVLHHFNSSTDGSDPRAALVQGSDGNFYGTASTGGPNGYGTVFVFIPAPLIPTTTALTTSPNPSTVGEAVTMTATVHAQNGSLPTGTVMFSSNGTSIGSAPLDNSGVAVLDYSGLPPGTDNIVANYSGSDTLAGSTSNTVHQVVQLPLSTTTVTSTLNPSQVGQQVTFTATVGPAGPPPPSGTVSFTSNGTPISGCTSVTLASQDAQCITSALPVGTDAIVATYSGDSNYTGSTGMLVQIVNPLPSPLQFVAVTPCRIVDTRNPNGPFGGPPIAGRSARSFPLTEGDNPCGIPSSAVAYSLNVTVVPQTTLNFLTIWPTGEGQPTVSTLNAPDGRTKANAAIVPAGSPGGGVSVYVTQTTNVIIDINGYFKPADSSTLQFYPVTPCRVADTRNPNGPLGGPALTGGVERDFPVLSSSCSLPASAVAYSLNFTALPRAGHLGFLTVWPQGLSRPTVSTLNDPTGTTVANAAIVPAGTGGGVATYASQDTNLIIDVNGYFAAPGTGGLSLYVLTPCRVLDTRNGSGAFSGELTVHVMNSFCEVAGAAKAYVFNATVIPVTHLGFLTLWPDGQQQPVASTLNAPDGAITSNMAIVPTNNGSIDAYASQLTQLILDISSYLAP